MTPGRHRTDGTDGVGDGCGGSVRGAEAGEGAGGDASCVGGATVAEPAGRSLIEGDTFVATEWLLGPQAITSRTTTSDSALMPV